MRDKQVRGAVVQWLVPSAILVIAIVVMFIDFYVKSSNTAQNQVDKMFISTADNYATQMSERLVSMQKSGKTVAAIMGLQSREDFQLVKEAVHALHMQTDACMVIMSNMEGTGVNQDGERTQLYALSYFEQLKDGEEKFIYLENEELTEEKIIMVVLPIYSQNIEESENLSGMLLLYYPVKEFQQIVKKGEYDGNAFLTLTDISGEIIERSSGTETFYDGNNLWENLGENTSLGRIRLRMQNHNTGVTQIADEKAEYNLAYAPVGINDLYIAVGIRQEYAEQLKNQEWYNTRSMLFRLIAIISIFLLIVVVINIVSKVRSNERSHDLENKADTDLLTGLNNKLATERKIKDYIKNHPQEQALMFIFDIDNFKKINDTMGHAFGDEVLRTLGHELFGEFRASDILGRTGGDEFTIFLRNIKDDMVVEQADRVVRFFKNFQAGEYVKYSATASVGVAVYPRDGQDFESLYKAADQALYTAKKRGKNQLAFYGDDK